MAQNTHSRPIQKRHLLFLALPLMVAAAFSPLWFADFLFYDDPVFVTGNPQVTTGLRWSNLVWAFTTHYADYWRPLSWISHMIDCQFFGLNPRGHHLMNLAIHALNSCLVFYFFKEATGRPGRSFLLAVLFAIHPLHVESVAWIAERKDVLSAFFALLSLIFYSRYARKLKGRNYLAAMAFFLAGLMSKPMVITLPAIFLILDFWPLGRFKAGESMGRPAVNPGRLILEKLPFALPALAVAAMTWIGQQKIAAMASLQDWGLMDRVLNAVTSITFYLEKTIWPSKLAVFYPKPEQWALLPLAVAFLVMTGLSWMAWNVRKSRPWFLAGWLWFLVMLLPVLGLIQVGDQARADRYTYLPLIGIFVILLWELGEWLESTSHPAWVTTATSAAVVGICLVLTWRQSGVWKNTSTLFTHAYRVTSKNYLASTVLGRLMVNEDRMEEGIPLFRQALSWRKDFSDAHLHWGVALEKQENVEEALEHYRQAIRIKPTFEEAHLAAGHLQFRRGKHAEAAHHYQAIFQTNPDSAEAHYHLALAWQQLGRTGEAIPEYQKAFRLGYNTAALHQNLAMALHQSGRSAEAAEHYRAALRQNPGSIELWLNLVTVLLASGNLSEGLFELETLERSTPESAPVLNRLAWIRSTHPLDRVRDGARGLDFSTRACILTQNKDPVALNVLAAAQAETGSFSSAVETQKKAVQLAGQAGNEPMRQAFEEILKLYEKGLPYRDPPVSTP